MASSQLTFTYFDVRGLGEVSRIVLAYGEKEFKDVRVTFDDWPSVKQTMPLGQMPLLDIDGDLYTQSQAIEKFLAREFGLYPKDNRDQLVVDEVMGVHMDIVQLQAKWYYQPDSPERTEKGIQARKDTVKHLQYLENILKKKGTGYFVGKSVTLADIVMFDIVTGYCRKSIDYSAEKYPCIAKNVENVLKVDKIKAYVDQRPESEL